MKTTVAIGIGFIIGVFVGRVYAKGHMNLEDIECETEGRPETVPLENEKSNEAEVIAKFSKDKPDISVYLNRYNMTSTDSKPESIKIPYVISPEEFVNPDYDNYAKITLSWYSSETLVDEDERIIPKHDYESKVGNTFHEHYGEYEEDCVYVRNDRRKTDYEILAVAGSYDDVLHRKPYLEDENESDDE